MLGERAAIRGRADGPARRVVKLQKRGPFGDWRTLDRRTTKRDRTFRFPLGVTRNRAVTLGVVVAARRKPYAAPWRSHPTRLAPTPQVAEAVVPTEARVGEPVVVTAAATPALVDWY